MTPARTSLRAAELTRRFYEWERRGSGWDLHPHPVRLEPPFRFFDRAPSAPAVDDGRRPTWRSLLFRRPPPRPPEEPAPRPFAWSEPLVELVLLFPPDRGASAPTSLAWIESLTSVRAPVAFELVGRRGRVELRLACASGDSALVTRALRSAAPDAVIQEAPGRLATLWRGSRGDAALVEFGLGREFVLPLATENRRDPDPLALLVGGLADTQGADVALVQVLFEPASAPWREAIRRAMTTPSGLPFFADAPELTRLAADKAASPLFAVALRVAATAGRPGQAFEIVRAVAGGLGRLGAPTRNALVPLAGGEPDRLERDVLERTSHRTGMLLSARELVGLVRLPGERSAVPGLVRLRPGKVAPDAVTQGHGLLLGENRAQGEWRAVRLSDGDRLRHVHVTGGSGTGKSTLLVGMILQDIGAGRGVAVLDVHGDLADDVLGRLPEGRAGDVIVFDPSDPEAVVGWNLLAAEGEAERQMLASDLVAVFQRLSTSWGDQMSAVLANAILAFLDSPRGGTLLDLRRFLVDKAFRDGYLRSVADPHLRSFWATEFPLIAGRRPQAPILTRLDTLLRHRLVRDVVTLRSGHLDFRAVVEERRVFLGRLAQGVIGQENAALLGSLLLSKLHQVALGRQDTPASARSPFFVYVDECQELATPSLAAMFSGARKFGLGLTVAHQDLHQLRQASPEVERSVLANAHTRVVFRVGSDDARALAAGFSDFGPEALTALATGEAVARAGGSLDDFNLTTAPLPPVDAAEASARRARVTEASRTRWGTPRAVLRAAEQPILEREDRAESLSHRTAPVKAAEPVAEAEIARLDTPPQPLAEQRPAPGMPDVPTEPSEGRGGPEHRYLQSLIREWAQARGFHVEVERELPGGGRVDLVLTRDELRVACEVSVTTGGAHEAENVRKCLAAGFGRVFVVSLKRRFLKALDKRLDEELGAEERERASVVAPEELLAWLASEPARVGAVAGYSVRTQVREADAAGTEARRRTLAEVVGRSLQRLKRDEP